MYLKFSDRLVFTGGASVTIYHAYKINVENNNGIEPKIVNKLKKNVIIKTISIYNSENVIFAVIT